MIDINSLRERDNTEIFSVSSLNLYIKNIFENKKITLRKGLIVTLGNMLKYP